MELPETFLTSMKALLGVEYEEWLLSMSEESYAGLRFNRSKTDLTDWQLRNPFPGEPIPWADNGAYYSPQCRPALDPYYAAGLYYIQEPSAMLPAAVLRPEPGDYVLDLCAAPGGKSTELGACLYGTGGLLVSNDISHSRAKALLKNLEMAGITDLLVTSETPEKLADTFGAFFDKVLVDAPCSGEGMFRRDPDLIRSWEERGPEYYVPIQREICRQAIRLLKPGGRLLYSTCTFERAEDEGIIEWLLQEEPSMEVVKIPLFEGACGGIGLDGVIRLFPHRVRGEGHFAALLQKRYSAGKEDRTGRKSDRWRDVDRSRRNRNETMSCRQPDRFLNSGKSNQRKANQRKAGVCCSDIAGYQDLVGETDFAEWESHFPQPFVQDRMMIRDRQVYLLPECFSPVWQLRYLRTGLLLGECRKNRFEPSQAAALAIRPGGYSLCLSLSREDERVIRYLKGETIALQEGENLPDGWILVCVDGFSLGWAKCSGGRCKNKYETGWRRQ
ncbi:MAG: RsmB/NOP family class I SAM-dependent RNA methyltransferase [Clostridiales bacterium]|nr:RsmB/NOP family class I SAM-dependent RNA methyltransferase [Clostridiales bacterium]